MVAGLGIFGAAYLAGLNSGFYKNMDEIKADTLLEIKRQYDEFITILKNWKQEIINSFTRIDGRRVNNSYIESKNRQIEHLMNNANGFVNFQRTRNRILYCLNKSDTYLF